MIRYLKSVTGKLGGRYVIYTELKDNTMVRNDVFEIRTKVLPNGDFESCFMVPVEMINEGRGLIQVIGIEIDSDLIEKHFRLT